MLFAACGGGSSNGDNALLPTPKPTPSSATSSTPNPAPSATPTATPNPTGTPTDTASPSPSPSPVVNDPDIATLMSELNCTASSCHDSSPGMARIDLQSGSMEDIAKRLIGQPSGASACQGEVLIDPDNAENSLFLKLIRPNYSDICALKMPIDLEGKGVSQENYARFARWVDSLIELQTPAPSPSPVPDVTGGSESLTKAQAFTIADYAKSLTVGSAINPAEYASLTTGDTLDRVEYEALLNDWISAPAFQQKLLHMMRLLLHQNVESIANSLYNFQTGGLFFAKNVPLDTRRAAANLDEMFARTAVRIINDDEDFRKIITTRDWEVTTVGLAALARADRLDFRTVDENYRLRNMPGVLDSDYDDWRTVRLTQSATSADYELSSEFVAGLRAIPDGGSMPLLAPRVGFFNSPAFLYNWETNTSNQFRITANEALIVAISKTFEVGDITAVNHTNGLAQNHVDPETECYSCHQRLDPMRNVFRKYYDDKTARAKSSVGGQNPDFSFHGVSENISDMDDFARVLAGHPDFAFAWAAKVCQYFTSIECDKKDAASVKTLAEKFAASNYRFKTLLVELFKSPLVIDSFRDSNNLSLSIARRDHYCFRIDNRIDDIRRGKSLDPDDVTFCDTSSNYRAAQVEMIPAETIGRGHIGLLQATQLDPFYAKSVEFLCKDRARFQISNDDSATFNRDDASRSLDDLVQQIMGIPTNHDDYQSLRNTIQNIYDLSRASPVCNSAAEVNLNHGGSPSCGLDLNAQDAMENVWQLMCSSPAATSIGVGY